VVVEEGESKAGRRRVMSPDGKQEDGAVMLLQWVASAAADCGTVDVAVLLLVTELR